MTKVNNLTPFTFESTGESVFIKPVPVMLTREVERSIPMPEPPAQEIEGFDGVKRVELNRSHPDYIAALEERSTKVMELMTALIIRRGVVVKLTDEQRDEVRQLREDVKDLNGIEWRESDESVWVRYIACQSHTDLTRLIKEVSAKSVPSDPKSRNGSTPSMSPSEATTSSDSQPIAAG